jgi:hypothetical protein
LRIAGLAASSPLVIAKTKKARFTALRAGRPWETFVRPQTVWASGKRFMISSMALSGAMT